MLRSTDCQVWPVVGNYKKIVGCFNSIRANCTTRSVSGKTKLVKLWPSNKNTNMLETMEFN